jgi:hypothetical protein
MQLVQTLIVFQQVNETDATEITDYSISPALDDWVTLLLDDRYHLLNKGRKIIACDYAEQVDVGKVIKVPT